MLFWKNKKQQKPKPKQKPVAHAKTVQKSNPSTMPSNDIHKKPIKQEAQPIKREKSKNDISKNPTEEKPKIKWEEQKAKKEFLKIFRQLTVRQRAWDVWRDFIVMASCSLSNPLDKTHYDEREKRYLGIIAKYKKEEQDLFPELFAQVVLGLEEEPEQDFLGDIFRELELCNKSDSQFFTPYHVCDVMAKLAVGDIYETIEKQGYITICDSCCGAGATLIAGIHEIRRQLEKHNLNFQNHVLVVGQDIDEVVALMCYIQLSLLGVAGYIKVGNSLTEPIAEGDSTENYWFTPMYFSDVWSTRRIIKTTMELLKGEKDAK